MNGLTSSEKPVTVELEGPVPKDVDLDSLVVHTVLEPEGFVAAEGWLLMWAKALGVDGPVLPGTPVVVQAAETASAEEVTPARALSRGSAALAELFSRRPPLA